MWKATNEDQAAQKADEKTDFRKRHGVAGHRHPDFLKRAREHEAMVR